MGWLSNLLQKMKAAKLAAESQVAEEININIDGLSEHIKLKTEPLLLSEKQQAESLINSILAKKESTIELLNKLESADPDRKRYPEQIVEIAQSIRDSFCKLTRQQFQRLSKPEMNYNSLEEFRSTLANIFEKVSLNPKQAELIPLFFGKPFGKFMETVQELIKLSGQLNQVVSTKSLLNMRDQVLQHIEKSTILNKDIEEIASQISVAEYNLKTAEKSKKDIEEQVYNLAISMKSPLDKEINELEARKAIITQKIDRQFEPLSKPLKKVKYFAEKYKINLDLLDRYIESFSVGLRYDKKMHLKKIMTCLLKPDLKLEQRIVEKIEALKQSLENFDRSEFEKEYNTLTEKIKEKLSERDAQLRPALSVKFELEKQSSAFSQQIGDFKIELEAKMKLLNKKSEEFNDLKEDLQKKANALNGVNVKIN